MLESTINFFGGRLILFNMVLLLILVFVFSLNIRNKIYRCIYSFIFSFLITLQLVSIYLTKQFIGYEFLIHLNFYNIFAMFDFFSYEIFTLLLIYISFIFLFFCSNFFYQQLVVLARFLFFLIQNKIKFIYVKFIILFISLLFFFKNGEYSQGLLLRTFETIKLLSYSYDSSNSFYDEILDLGITQYTETKKLNISTKNNKDNVFIILESFETAFFDTTFSHILPYINNLKKDWNFIDIKQNIGSNWTVGSLYTLFTGMPAFFGGGYGNSIFKTAYKKNIFSLTDIFKLQNHDLVHISNNAKFASTNDLLMAFDFDKIIDGDKVDPGFDSDIFKKLKSEMKKYKSDSKNFSIFVSTLDTHGPHGLYDKRFSNKFSTLTNLKYSARVLDSLVHDFVDFLEIQNFSDNTNVFILPDHKYMAQPDIFDNIDNSNLFLLTNIRNKIELSSKDNLHQVHLPKLILHLIGIDNNAIFISDYFEKPINKFIKNNTSKITSINVSGLQRLNYNSIDNDIPSKQKLKNKGNLIAHGGGGIDGYIYTNSLEALNQSYENGFRLFELDINLTNDNKLVAVHNWSEWNQLLNNKFLHPPSYEKFINTKIHNMYTPLDMDRINDWFSQYPDAILVTDKINDPILFNNQFNHKDRLIMELFSFDAIEVASLNNIDYIISETLVNKYLQDSNYKYLYNKNISFHYNFGINNYKSLMKLSKNGTAFYIYGINTYHGLIDSDNRGTVTYNEQFVVDGNIFGENYFIYADKFVIPSNK